MKKKDLERFRQLFEEEKKALMEQHRKIREEFVVREEDRCDELDQATTDTEQSMRVQLRNRELLYLRKLDNALKRIEEGIFGECVACDEPIELRRLEARPTADLCLSCKEEEERMRGLTARIRTTRNEQAAFHYA